MASPSSGTTTVKSKSTSSIKDDAKTSTKIIPTGIFIVVFDLTQFYYKNIIVYHMYHSNSYTLFSNEDKINTTRNVQNGSNQTTQTKQNDTSDYVKPIFQNESGNIYKLSI